MLTTCTRSHCWINQTNLVRNLQEFKLNTEIRLICGNSLPIEPKCGAILPMRHIPILLTALILAPPAWGVELQSHESIRGAAERHVRELNVGQKGRLEIGAAKLDRRLRLKKCERDLETFSSGDNPGRSRYSIGVRCTSDQPWALYVPVSMSVFREVLVMDRQVDRGRLLTRADIRLEEQDITRYRRGYLEHPKQALGKTPKRSLKAGTVLSTGLLESSTLVSRGSRVTILGEIGGIEVRMEGKALGNGALGERVQVKNSSSNRRIEATVVAAGIVQVSL